jgi:hypothetical protein
MVLESLFDAKVLLKEPFRFFLLVLLLSFLGIGTAYFLFPEYLGVMAVSFIALLLLPLLNNIFICSAKSQFSEKKLTIKYIVQQHFPTLKIFFVLMLAVFMTFLFLGLVHSPDMSANLFKAQLSFVGNGTSNTNLDFHAIAQNNLRVMYVTFGISLIYGAGVIIMLSWNASVWGIIIGTTIRKGLTISGSNILAYIAVNLLQIMPHLLLESMAYLGAAISGGMLALCAVFQKGPSKKFLYTLTDSFLILVISIALILISALIEINI